MTYEKRTEFNIAVSPLFRSNSLPEILKTAAGRPQICHFCGIYGAYRTPERELGL
jgi:hypothetical protein